MRLLCATLEPTLDEKIAYITRERNYHILCGREHEGAMLNTILASLERLKALEVYVNDIAANPDCELASCNIEARKLLAPALDASPSICETEQKVSNSAYTAGALDARKEGDVRWRCSGCEQEIDPTTCGCGSPITHEAWGAGHTPIPMGCDCYRERSPASRDGRQGELSRLIERTVFDAYREGYMQGNEVSVRYEYEIRVAHAEGRACAYYDARRERLERAFAPAAAAEGDTHNQD